jgi:hypothetical protein
MSTQLTGLTNTNGVALDRAPSIHTNMLYQVSTTNPPTCQTIISDAKVKPSVDTFLQTYKIGDSGTGIDTSLIDLKKNLDNFYNSLVSDGVDQRRNIDTSSTSTNNNSISTYLTNLETTQIPILRLVDSCMKENLTFNFDALEKQKQETDESKLRLESVKDPETKVSYYEGWFPLIRPMSEPALFGIFITAVFLLILSVGVFLRMSGIQFNISLPTLFIDTGYGLDTKKYMYIGLGIGAAGGLGIYGYEKGWFGSKNNN